MRAITHRQLVTGTMAEIDVVTAYLNNADRKRAKSEC